MENKQVIARTGRVQSWIDDPTSRLPVSCTIFKPTDSMEGPDGIEASWRFVSMLSAMAQELQYIYRVSDLEDRKMVRDWLRVVPSLLEKSIPASTNNSDAEVSTKTEQ